VGDSLFDNARQETRDFPRIENKNHSADSITDR
jgi:hypothetical protein